MAGLRRRGIDVTTAADEGLLGAPDAAHMVRAGAHERLVVTADHDLLAMAHSLVEEGTGHQGILFVLPGTGVGDAIRAIALAAEVLEPSDMVDWVEWIG